MTTNHRDDYEIKLDLPNAIRSLSFYVNNDDEKNQLKFDPTVYQARYSAISCILDKEEWIPHIKKVRNCNFKWN